MDDLCCVRKSQPTTNDEITPLLDETFEITQSLLPSITPFYNQAT